MSERLSQTGEMIAQSFSAADRVPAKLIQNTELIKQIRDGYIPPYHVQFIPTNRCNLKCSFCSCSEDDRRTSMPWPTVLKLIPTMYRSGTRSVTITGGGEPLLYEQINELIEKFYDTGIEIGLVTNGTQFHNLKDRSFERIKWCRISHSDDRPFSQEYQLSLSREIARGPRIDWAFSYVLAPEVKVKEIAALVAFAYNRNFTHVRIVSDLLQPDKIPLEETKKAIKKLVANDQILLYQSRDKPESGMPCWIAYLKPVVAADGKIYRCCGVQYALDKPSKNLPKELCMGTDFDAAVRDYSSTAQGLKCKKCYYGEYNRIIGAMMIHTKHERFV